MSLHSQATSALQRNLEERRLPLTAVVLLQGGQPRAHTRTTDQLQVRLEVGVTLVALLQGPPRLSVNGAQRASVLEDDARRARLSVLCCARKGSKDAIKHRVDC